MLNQKQKDEMNYDGRQWIDLECMSSIVFFSLFCAVDVLLIWFCFVYACALYFNELHAAFCAFNLYVNQYWIVSPSCNCICGWVNWYSSDNLPDKSDAKRTLYSGEPLWDKCRST